MYKRQGVDLLRGLVHRDKVIGRGDFRKQRPFAFQRRIIVNLFGLQFDHIAITLKNTVRQDAAQMFQVNAATIDSRVKGFGHFLNILRTDDTPVTGVTLNADTKEF